MSVSDAHEVSAAKRVLKTFSTYGYKKTSMQDIATAAGVSRQSIYKKFGNKDTCYAFVINTYLVDMYTRIFAKLDEGNLPVNIVLQEVFNIFIGDAIDVVTQAHGTEVFSDCLKATQASKDDWPLRFKSRLADFLAKSLNLESEKAMGMAFTLIASGKGLLLEEATREKFNQDMDIIIHSITAS